ncbi:response regulator [Microlunatus flavus]|uniref:DNA-binding response regulator, NarL/FixJ family, contains REC and HTH domains n=1 Tax=Microlunatus flavus TaxID=1036181 RepID=A0A1H8ZRU7_9ACTN|nr:response regulator transcription factor [Microlunatus flavus]SEP67220.1 DNA-binding response regulator, NarL/FixJ family, contains REC and HTH domains [Microlunatus flavus]
MAEPERPVRVVVADDQTVVRDGVCLMLRLAEGVEVVGTAADGAEAVEVVAATVPDVLLVDLRMPGVDGVEATRRVRALERPPAVVVLTTFDDETSVLAALRAGALGYLTKDADAPAIADAIRSAAAGRSLLDAGVQARLVAAAGSPGGAPAPGPAVEGLTPREVEVLRLVARGAANREVARELVLSEATVKTHVNHLLAKLAVRDRAQLVAWAYQHGVV